jgi:hypothetical protein
MTRGILLFAFQGEFDYIGLATKAALRLKRYLGLPISVITNDKEKFQDHSIFDHIIQINDDTILQKKIFHNGSLASNINTWKNSSRSLSFNLTPYDETLVLDTDYVVNSDFLLKCFSLNTDFLIFKDSCDLAQWRDTQEFQFINEISIPFYWATVFYFKKTEKNRLLFELITFIKDNWDYYRLLYQITSPTFRNDFAFSIAIHIFSGYDSNNFQGLIPGKMYYTLDKDQLHSIDNSACTFLVEKENNLGEYTAIKTNNLDVHVMNKYSLMEVL